MILDILYSVEQFIHKGGDVLIIIFMVAFIMWWIILDKIYLHIFVYPKLIREVALQNRYLDKKEFLNIKDKIGSNMALFKVTILVSPLLGLLGTVSGMIEVFDIISIVGNSDPKAMSSGISKATIPTMVGMSVALSGMIFKVYLEQINKKRLRALAMELRIDFIGKKGK